MQAAFTEETSAINEAIAKLVGPQKHRVWFRNSTKINIADGYVVMGVPNHFIASYIEGHFSDQISTAVKSVTGRDKKVTFNIDPSLSGEQKKSQLDSQAKQIHQQYTGNVRRKIKRTQAQRNNIELKLRLNDFIVGSANEMAYNACRAVIHEKTSPFNPLFIHGGYGLGKTHLLQGLCNEISAKRDDARWIYVSAEQFANEFVLGLKTQKLDAFRARYRKVDLLAIDDIHFLANKPSMQEEFLHTFNSIDLAGKQVVLASDAHPKMIGQLCEKLVNRFVSGMVVKVDTPDLDTRCKICYRWAKKTGKDIPQAVIRYIAENMRTNIRELEGAMLKLVAFSSLSKDAVNLSMAQEVLGEHISRSDPIVHISDIGSVVTNYFGITMADVNSSRKDRTVSLARSYIMYLARKYTKMSYPEIGRVMGGKNHATVILACRKIEDLVKRNAEIKWNCSSGNRIAKAATTLNELIDNIS